MKKQRLLSYIIIICLITVMLIGCGKDATSPEITDPDLSASPTETSVTTARTVVPAPTSYISDDILFDFSYSGNLFSLNESNLNLLMNHNGKIYFSCAIN